MRKIKNISLALTLTPLLFVGCVQEKVSQIIPSKLTDNYKRATMSATDISENAKDKSTNVLSESELDKLVALVQKKLAQEAIQKKKKIQPSKIQPSKKNLKQTPKKQTPKKQSLVKSTVEEDADIYILPEETPLFSEIKVVETDTTDNTPELTEVSELTELAETAEVIDESNFLDTLTELVSNELDTEITGIEGQYTTPIVINENSCNIFSEQENTTKNYFLKEIKKYAKNMEEAKNIKEGKSIEERKSKKEKIISTAMAFLNIPYIWAANGPTSFDCSGFTKYVYKKNGMSIPRYSGNQAKTGVKVNYNELEIGDLVFFNTEKKYKRKVTHVGIYIGNHKFIHASSAKKKVVITSFDKKHFYKERFLWGQRIVKDGSTYASL